MIERRLLPNTIGLATGVAEKDVSPDETIRANERKYLYDLCMVYHS